MIVIRTDGKSKRERLAQYDDEFRSEDYDYLGQQTPGGRFVSPGEFTPEEINEQDLDYLGQQTPEGIAVAPDPDDFVEPSLSDIKDSPERIKPATEFTFLPFAPSPETENTPVDPGSLVGDEEDIPKTSIEKANDSLDTREKIFYSLNNGTPLRIQYKTLDGSVTSERTVHPDYVYWAGTNRHILVAWDELRNDWRAFSVDNIQRSKLLQEGQEVWPTEVVTEEQPLDLGGNDGRV